MNNPPHGAGTVVIGLGNPLMGDDGLGLAALERLRAGWRFHPPPSLVDGGTWGMNLLHEIEEAKRVLLVDAINADRPPGTLVVLGREDLPRFFAMKLSPHQIDMKEVLAVAELRGRLPDQTVAMGVQPQHIEMSTQLSDAAREGLPPLVAAIVGQLEAWGHRAEARTQRTPD
jgi:hydrogenase maturation protease